MIEDVRPGTRDQDECSARGGEQRGEDAEDEGFSKRAADETAPDLAGRGPEDRRRGHARERDGAALR